MTIILCTKCGGFLDEEDIEAGSDMHQACSYDDYISSTSIKVTCQLCGTVNTVPDQSYCCYKCDAQL